MDAAALARAAERALSPLWGPVTVRAGDLLTGSERSTVVRARATTSDGDELAVVLKAPAGSGPGAVREEAALRVAVACALPGPVRLLASWPDPPVLVLADAGRAPTLADHLLGPDAGVAEAALLRWARALGTLQASSVACREAFERELAVLSPFGPPVVDTTPDDLVGGAASLARDLPRLGVTPGTAALDDLRHAADGLVTPASGLVPGDTCPDNAVDTADGVVLVDFEAAVHRHVAWEGAYLTVPWPTCWCCWRLPEDVTGRALAGWREALEPAVPSVGGPGMADDLARTTVAWAFLSVAWLLPAALAGDPPPRNPALVGGTPTRRAMIQHRLGLAAALETPVLPALRALAEQAHAASLAAWGWQELELAPAFR